MNRSFLLFLAVFLGLATLLPAAEPMTFEELSLMLRTGSSPQEILNDVTRRKLLQPLNSTEQEALREHGAPPALLNALQSSTLFASVEEAAAYRAHHQPARQIVAASPADPGNGVRGTPPRLQPVLLSDRFMGGIEAAKDVPEQPVRITDAYSLDHLAEAKAQAQLERKVMGFVQMAPTMLDKPVTTRSTGASAALLHFCHAFKDSMVLVFVPSDTKQGLLPPAVVAGLAAKEMNGILPNMAVVDATAMTLVLPVPSAGNNKATGEDRDKIFVAAAAIMQRWLSYHPMAIGVTEARQAAR
ncbi:MAG TPA: hypothetical protein VGM54_07460 [Chthoniobacter sp.]|jgi:hypothetical protein